MMEIKCIGGCVPLFFVAIAIDVIGLVVLFVGIFANLRIEGRFYGDFLIYSGSLIIFSSLACWLMWYIGNLRVQEETSLNKKSSFVRLARKLSERLSKKLNPEVPRSKIAENEDCGRVALPAHKASKVTWGKSDGYLNNGYDSSLESIPNDNSKTEPDLSNKGGIITTSVPNNFTDSP